MYNEHKNRTWTWLGNIENGKAIKKKKKKKRYTKSIHIKCGVCAKCYNMTHLAHQTPKTELYQMS